MLAPLAVMGQTLAFPTAEGFGKYASGGRGGEVVEVTNLLDNPDSPIEGSFRWALKQHPGKPITVVFRVSGIIDLNGHDLRSKRNDVTIAGQTAPGDGICLKGGCFNLGGSRNIIIRHMRFRQGILGPDDTYQPGVVDDANFIKYQALGWENGGLGIIDHCSFSWSAEEVVNMYDSDHTTLQWCIISEALYNAGHGKGNRSFGAVWGGKSASYHHNLLAHNKSRSPRLGSTTKNDLHTFLDIVNNVNYNWGNENACYGGDNRYGNRGLFELNFENNYYKPGPARPGTKRSYFVNASFCKKSNQYVGQEDSYGHWHLDGNYMDGDYASKNGFNTDNYKAFCISEYTSQVSGLKQSDLISDHIDVGEFGINKQSAQDAYTSVLAGSGAFPRDSHDTRITNEVSTGTAQWYGTLGQSGLGIIDKPSDSGGYPTYNTYDEITDADHDGMDDAWETANGFDPTNPEDRNTQLKGGYTALEAYLCSLVGEVIEIAAPKPYDIVVAQDGTGDFTTINAAIEAAPDNGQRTTIFVRNGEYNEKVFIGNRWQESSKIISIVGESRDGVVISWDDYNGKQIDYPGKGTISADGTTSPTMTVMAPDFYMENVTVRNTVREKVAQAVTLYQAGDRQVLKNCVIEGYQDTHRTRKGRRYFLYGCTVKGNTDFIYGGGMAYFYKCGIVSRPYVDNGAKGGYITAPEDVTYKTTLSNGKPLYYEFIFNDCDLTAEDAGHQNATLGRPWADQDCGAVFLNTRMGGHISAAGWGGNGNSQNMSFCEYNSMNPDGTPLDVSKRVNWSYQIPESDLSLLDLKDAYTAVSSTEFNPVKTVVSVKNPTDVTVSKGQVSWTVSEGAVGYVVYIDGKFTGFSEGSEFLSPEISKSSSVIVKAIAANGALSDDLSEEEIEAAVNPFAHVAVQEVTVNASVLPTPEAGTVEPATVTVSEGSEVSFTATPSTDYKFLYWTDAENNVLGRGLTLTFSATESKEIFANFESTVMSDENYHSPVVSDYAFELVDMTQVPVKDEANEWVISEPFTKWMSYNVYPVQVGGRMVQLDPVTGETKDFYTYGTNNMIRVGSLKHLSVFVKETSKIKIYFNGAASTNGHLVVDVTPVGGETTIYETTKEVGKSSSPQSDCIEIPLNGGKYEIVLKGTQDMAIWALNLWPGGAGLRGVVVDVENADLPIYNLQGIQVTNPVPGHIYIRGGQKFILR